VNKFFSKKLDGFGGHNDGCKKAQEAQRGTAGTNAEERNSSAEAQRGKAATKEDGRWRIENGLKPLPPHDMHMIRRENLAKKTRFLGIALQRARPEILSGCSMLLQSP